MLKLPKSDTMKPREQNWAWVWLAYTGFLFIDPLIAPAMDEWAGTLAVFAVFLAIFAVYVRATDRGSAARYWMIAATFVLGLVTFPWNQGGSCLFVYAAAFLPFAVVPIRRVLALIGLQMVVVLLEGWYFTANQPRHSTFYIGWPNTWIALFLMAVIGAGQIFFAEQRRAECRLRAAEEENVALAAVAERERIARDLHDVLGHTLSVIVLKAELAERLVGVDAERAKAEMLDVERTARTALAEVREAIGGYRARGLTAEIEAARRTLDSAGVTLVAETSSEGATLSAEEETVLSLALREAVTNIVRHSKASTCTLRLEAVDGARWLTVEDNGSHADAREGNGLRGMRERVEALGGQLVLEREAGTRLQVTLPLRSETR